MNSGNISSVIVVALVTIIVTILVVRFEVMKILIEVLKQKFIAAWLHHMIAYLCRREESSRKHGCFEPQMRSGSSDFHSPLRKHHDISVMFITEKKITE